jgi:hypothetical protein
VEFDRNGVAFGTVPPLATALIALLNVVGDGPIKKNVPGGTLGEG